MLKFSITRCAARIPPPQRYQRKLQMIGLILTFLGMILCGVWAGGEKRDRVSSQIRYRGCSTNAFPVESFLESFQRQERKASGLFPFLFILSSFLPSCALSGFPHSAFVRPSVVTSTWRWKRRERKERETRRRDRRRDRWSRWTRRAQLLFSGSIHHLEVCNKVCNKET